MLYGIDNIPQSFSTRGILLVPHNIVMNMNSVMCVEIISCIFQRVETQFKNPSPKLVIPPPLEVDWN